eukprot:SAG11_NODE_25154_length_363_cov_0.590909_1_plen_52_part_10
MEGLDALLFFYVCHEAAEHGRSEAAAAAGEEVDLEVAHDVLELDFYREVGAK